MRSTLKILQPVSRYLRHRCQLVSRFMPSKQVVPRPGWKVAVRQKERGMNGMMNVLNVRKYAKNAKGYVPSTKIWMPSMIG